MMAAPTPEQLRQKVGVVSLSRFLATPATEQAFIVESWRKSAATDRDSASLDTRWSARAQLQRLDEWSAAAGLIPTPAAPATA